MHAHILWRVVAVVAVGVSAGASARALQDAPDAHIVGPVRGDVLEIHGASPSWYVAPYPGWRYSRLRSGDRLRARFYGERYQVVDPQGLPAARGNRRWVRYGNDLLLVNIRTGRVLRVLADRFVGTRAGADSGSLSG